VRRRSVFSGSIVILLLGIAFVLGYLTDQGLTVLEKHLYPVEFSEIVNSCAEMYDLDEAVIYALIKETSSFSSNHVSEDGKIGLMQLSKETFLWLTEEKLGENLDPGLLYEPQTKRNLAGGPSGWGAAAVIDAIEEGLAGIRDLDTKYRKLTFSPRWPVTEYRELRYATGCEAAKTRVDVYHTRTDSRMTYRLSCPSESVECHILLPEGKICAALTVNGYELPFKETSVGSSRYADFHLYGGPTAESDRYGWAGMRSFEMEMTLADQ